MQGPDTTDSGVAAYGQEWAPVSGPVPAYVGGYLDFLVERDDTRARKVDGLIQDGAERLMLEAGILLPRLGDIAPKAFLPRFGTPAFVHRNPLLEATESLYRRGLVSYPLTDSRHLAEDDWPEAGQVVAALAGYEPVILAATGRLLDCTSRGLGDLATRISRMVDSGAPPPAPLYRAIRCTDHRGLRPLSHGILGMDRQPALTEAEMQVFYQVAQAYVRAHWCIVDKIGPS